MSDDLREALNDTEGDLAQLIPNPQDWSNWIIYFLEELEDNDNQIIFTIYLMKHEKNHEN